MLVEILYTVAVSVPTGFVVWAGWPRPPMAEWIHLPDPKGLGRDIHVPR